MTEETWKEKYYNLLQKTIKELEDTTLTAQRQAEMNVEASRNYIEELQSQLQHSQQKVKELEETLCSKSDAPSVSMINSPVVSISSDDSFISTLSSGCSKGRAISSHKRKRRACQTVSDTQIAQKVGFFESITCLTVHVLSSDETSTVYLCTLDDGELMGHEFRIVLSYDNWEYTYTPVNISSCLKGDNQLKKSFFFPDYMLPRFLTKLLNATYKNDTHSHSD